MHDSKRSLLQNLLCGRKCLVNLVVPHQSDSKQELLRPRWRTIIHRQMLSNIPLEHWKDLQKYIFWTGRRYREFSAKKTRITLGCRADALLSYLSWLWMEPYSNARKLAQKWIVQMPCNKGVCIPLQWYRCGVTLLLRLLPVWVSMHKGRGMSSILISSTCCCWWGCSPLVTSFLCTVCLHMK